MGVFGHLVNVNERIQFTLNLKWYKKNCVWSEVFFTPQSTVMNITSQKFFVFRALLLFMCLVWFQLKKVLMSVHDVAMWFPSHNSVTWESRHKLVVTHSQASCISTSQILCCDVIFYFVAWKSRHYRSYFVRAV